MHGVQLSSPSLTLSCQGFGEAAVLSGLSFLGLRHPPGGAARLSGQIRVIAAQDKS